MSFPAILLLAVCLAADATAVAAARGLALRRIELRHVVLVGTFFGGFQALMPLLGYLAGASLGAWVERWDHWIAFVLLGAIGAKMLHEARSPKDDETPAGDPFALRVLFVLALATSIDAFAAGVTLPLLGAPIVLSLVTIGVCTALLSAGGLFAGRRFGAFFGRRIESAAGLLLIGLGVKILTEHLWV